MLFKSGGIPIAKMARIRNTFHFLRVPAFAPIAISLNRSLIFQLNRHRIRLDPTKNRPDRWRFLTASLTFQHADQERNLSQPEYFFVDFGWEGSPDAFGPRAEMSTERQHSHGPWCYTRPGFRCSHPAMT